MDVGIESLNVYAGLARIGVRELLAGRGLDPDRQANLLMTSRSVGLPFEDPVTNAVNAAAPILAGLDPTDRAAIELLVTSTESGVDLSKSVASYVHDHLGLGRACRVLEVKQACYAATGAVQLAAGYLASGVSPGAKALVIATDVALVDARAGFAEPATGHGAVALLVSDRPRVLTLDLGAFGCHSYETLDSARPSPRFDIADVDRSLFTYLDCLTSSFAGYRDRVDGADFVTTFDQLAMHTPFAGLVRAAHRKMLREAGTSVDLVAADFERRVAPSLRLPAMVGNLCSGSVYLALASMLTHADVSAGARVGLYAYGSGCSAEFFSGLVDAGSARAVQAMGIPAYLAGRYELTFAEYTQLLADTADVLVPAEHRTVELGGYRKILERGRAGRPLLAHTGAKDYHRRYEWV
ncbi:MAG: hydroxymethylglutaryl-CoA synthase family protein [Actinobacteria bacterium]|nr:hydroxymethylglutaryl-CoA synthase family protein [Actinomycetota bacterium]